MTHNMEALSVRLDELLKLHRAVENAKEDLKAAVEVAAELSKLDAKNIKAFVAAKAGDKYDEKKDRAAQLSLIFDEVA